MVFEGNRYPPRKEFKCKICDKKHARGACTFKCRQCSKKGHRSENCWQKFPSLALVYKRDRLLSEERKNPGDREPTHTIPQEIQAIQAFSLIK